VVDLDAPPGTAILRPPPPGAPLEDVGAAVRDALRFPLAGEPLDALVPRGGRATVVVEPPALPIPGSSHDPRRLALSTAVGELVRLGIPTSRQTLLVTAGLARRPDRHELDLVVTPELARRFDGAVEVHDAEAPELVEHGSDDEPPARLNRALVDSDVVVVVTAAETVLHGGPATLLASADAGSMRGAGAQSLLETAHSSGWEAAVALERRLARRVPLLGVSLALHNPRLGGALHGYPYEDEALDRVARSRTRRLFGLLPPSVRTRILRSLPLDLPPLAAFAGPPSVAHAEALLRTIEARATTLDEPLDIVVIGVPSVTPTLPRERPNPLLAATVGLGLALRLWRDAFPVRDGGTAVLVHGFDRRFEHPTQAPYRAFFAAVRGGADPAAIAAAEQSAASDERAIAAYRRGRTCHPLQPFADWDACRPARDRLGTILAARCRDASAARQLGLIPTHGLRAALDMALGQAGGDARVGVLVSPPYFPIVSRGAAEA
jgi:hypothetical protein